MVNLLKRLIDRNKRSEIVNWLIPDAEGDWLLSHINPIKYAIREVA